MSCRPTRSSYAGAEGLSGRWDEPERERFADRMEAEVEALAPGFRDRVLGRAITAPADLEAADAYRGGGQSPAALSAAGAGPARDL